VRLELPAKFTVSLREARMAQFKNRDASGD
jgi:hypothetical protein